MSPKKDKMDNNTNSANNANAAPEIERVRHELRRRSLIAKSVTDITPGMRRVVLTGEDLADFVSLAPDDHIKVIVRGRTPRLHPAPLRQRRPQPDDRFRPP